MSHFGGLKVRHFTHMPTRRFVSKCLTLSHFAFLDGRKTVHITRQFVGYFEK